MKRFVSLCTILYQIKRFKPGLSRHWHSLAEDAAWQWASIPAALCSTYSLWFMLQTPGHQSLWWDGHGTFCHSQQIHRGTQPATNFTVLLRVGWCVVVATEGQRHFCCSLRSQWGKTSVTHSLGWSESAICLWITEVFLAVSSPCSLFVQVCFLSHVPVVNQKDKLLLHGNGWNMRSGPLLARYKCLHILIVLISISLKHKGYPTHKDWWIDDICSHIDPSMSDPSLSMTTLAVGSRAFRSSDTPCKAKISSPGYDRPRAVLVCRLPALPPSREKQLVKL